MWSLLTDELFHFRWRDVLEREKEGVGKEEGDEVGVRKGILWDLWCFVVEGG